MTHPSPKPHLFCELPHERLSMIKLLGKTKRALNAELQSVAYDIGVNDGLAAGQTMVHLLVHIIPRYAGDTDEPRGGARWIFPKKAKYWT